MAFYYKCLQFDLSQTMVKSQNNIADINLKKIARNLQETYKSYFASKNLFFALQFYQILRNVS